MTSNPPSDCCTRGFRHEGNAKGNLTTLADFEVYLSGPQNEAVGKGLLFLSDVTGHQFINSQLIADQFAEEGYVVLMPDLFYGDSIPLNPKPGFDIMKWLSGEYNEKKNPHNSELIDPIIEKSLHALRTTYNCKTVCTVGYCFGAKYVIRNLRPSTGKIDVGFVAHPSFVLKEELKAVTGPLAISAADKDRVFPANKRHETEEILKKIGFPYQINVHGGVWHGFALRGDVSQPGQKYAKEAAFRLANQWFEEHLKYI